MAMLCSGASQVALVVENPPVNARSIRDAGLIPGLGRSPGGGHDNPLQYSCLTQVENQVNAVFRITLCLGLRQGRSELI